LNSKTSDLNLRFNTSASLQQFFSHFALMMPKPGLGSRSTRSRMVWPEPEPFYFFFRSRTT